MGNYSNDPWAAPYLKCLTPEQSQYVLVELHEGICGNHPGGRTLAHQAHTQAYYWPTMRVDAANYTRKFDCYQRLAPVLKSPVQDLIFISSPWPFAQWGIDIVEPLPLTISVNGLRPKHSPRSKIRMSLSLSGRILYVGSTSTNQLCLTTGPNSTDGSIKLMSGIEDKKSILHPTVSAEQWSSRSLKQNPVNSPGEAVGFS